MQSILACTWTREPGAEDVQCTTVQLFIGKLLCDRHRIKRFMGSCFIQSANTASLSMVHIWLILAAIDCRLIVHLAFWKVLYIYIGSCLILALTLSGRFCYYPQLPKERSECATFPCCYDTMSNWSNLRKKGFSLVHSVRRQPILAEVPQGEWLWLLW